MIQDFRYAVRRLTDDLQPRIGSQNRAQSLPHHGMVVDDEDRQFTH